MKEGEAAAVSSSRLCVKNLPKYVDDKRLRELFSAKGEVTDVKVLKTRDGRSRQMAFVGFKTTQEAAAALKYFDRSYVDTARLEVEYARKVGDTELARPWSKHSAGSSANTKVAAGAKQAVEEGGAAAVAGEAGGGKDQTKGKGGKGDEADPKLQEFLSMMQPRSKAQLWANDELMPSQQALPAPPVKGKKQAIQAVKRAAAAAAVAAAKGHGSDSDQSDGDNDDEYQDLTGAPPPPPQWGSDGEDEDGDGRGNDGVVAVVNNGGRKTAALDAMSDLEYLKSRTKRWSDDEDDDEAFLQRGKGDDDDAACDPAASAGARGDQAGVGPSPHCQGTGGSKAKSKVKSKEGKQGKKTQEKGSSSSEEEQGSDQEQGGAAMDVDEEGRGWDAMEDGEGQAPDSHGEDHDDDAAMDREEGREGEGQGPQAGPPQREQAGGGGADEEDLRDTGRLFLRNLCYSASEADLAELFGAFGDLAEVHLLVDRETKRSKGMAYVQFRVPEDAVKAAKELDATIFQGRLLHILPAKRKPGSEAGPSSVVEGEAAAAAGGLYKVQRDKARKADAGNRSAWNTLFMRTDTVAEAVAAHYGISKAELLDKSSSDLAVRMALGEAHIIATTKAALAEAGVDVEKLEAAAAASGHAAGSKAVARSSTTLLVKNLPFSANEEELQELFSKPGPLARLVLPPSHTLALAEYLEPGDARGAFKALAYKKYHTVPLYLEWAPKDIFTAPAPQSAAIGSKATATAPAAAAAAAAGAAGAEATQKAAGKASVAADVEAEGAEDAGAEVGTLYVKNVSFNTSDEAFRKHFDKAVSAAGGVLHFAKIARRPGPNGSLLSSGYGFVECSSMEVAKAVIRKMQDSFLDGHKLTIQLSKRRAPMGPGQGSKGQEEGGKGGKAKAKDGEGSTKVVVRNVAFEATKKDIQGLFSPFGHLKSCRQPRKFDGSHRGFAFVEFTTAQEAKNAIEGVNGTHLYGRRLLVEYAADDDSVGDVELLRGKTAAKSRAGEDMGGEGADPMSRKKQRRL